MDIIVKALELTKTYQLGDIATDAVNQISFQVNKGDFVSIQGPSGCGKSSLLSMLGLMNPPSSGKLLLFGTDVATLGQKARAAMRNRHIGFIFQSFNLIDDLDVIDNVLLPAYYGKVKDIASKRNKAKQMLSELDLGQRFNHKPNQLSGGQQQRVAFVRSMIMEPELILADEPTGNLDSKSAETIVSLLAKSNDSGATIILVTHEPAFALQAKRQITLKDGRMISDQETMS